MYSPINPYNKNNLVLRNFFRKPVTLIVAIVYTLCILASFAYSFITIYQTGFDKLFSDPGNIPIISLEILPAIAFFMLFFRSRSKKPEVSFRAPINLIYVYTIIYISILGLLALLCCTVGVAMFLYLFLLLIFAIVPLAILLLYYISYLKLFCSISQSSKTIYLRKNGSSFLIVMSILSAVLGLLCSASFTVDFFNAFAKNINSSEFGAVNLFDDASFILGGINIFVESIVIAVFAGSYKAYINKVSNSIKGTRLAPAPQAPAPQPVQPQPVQAVNPVQPVSFTPQQVNFNSAPETFPAQDKVEVIHIPTYPMDEVDEFEMPEQTEPNPYLNNANQPSGMNTQNENPYQNFTPQNPFENN
jgi:hypothetical protein